MSTSKLYSKNVLEVLLNIFSLGIKKMNGDSFYFGEIGINNKEFKKIMKETNLEIKRIDNNKFTFESNILYNYFLIKIDEFLPRMSHVDFNSNYSALFFRRIINYLNLLIKSDIDIAEDETVKIFFYLLFLYIDENYKHKDNKSFKRKLDLDETFFKGTFIELTQKYSSKIQYEETEQNKNIINKLENKIKEDIISLIDFTFQKIGELIKQYGDQNDKALNDMYEKANDILYELDRAKDNNFSEELIKKIKNFYLIKENIIFTNYMCETEEEYRKKEIDSTFLNEIEPQFSKLNFDYIPDINNKKKLEDYLVLKKRKYQRLFLSSLPEVLEWDLKDEIIIFSIVENDITHGLPIKFERLQKFKDNLQNLFHDKIFNIANEILNDNKFYEYFFEILKSEIVKKFYTSHLFLDENDKEYQFIENECESSECFKDIYNNFLKLYNNKKECYKEFKNLIILKILPKGDRAYTITPLKKIIINPAQFFLGKNIKEEDIKIILKGYFIVILLHEIEHFFRLLNENNKVSNNTPREKEGGRLFIKYLFGVESINHIDKSQAEEIFKYDNWKKNKIKYIFKDQLEDVEENNIEEFILNYFSDSISFYTTKFNKTERTEKYVELKK